MTDEKKLTAMAEKLGWCCTNEGWVDPDNMEECLPAFDTDWNTRPKILEAMTEDEFGKFTDLVFHHYRYHFNNRVKRYSVLEYILIGAFTQPDFFNLAGQAMGLWEE